MRLVDKVGNLKFSVMGLTLCIRFELINLVGGICRKFSDNQVKKCSNKR